MPLASRNWLHADELGSVIATSNGSGAATIYSYGPYGEPDSTNGWAGSRFRYTGQIMLFEAQLYHYKARAYHPLPGQFLQTDPVGYQGGLNLYAYVGNDPLNATDPLGLLTCSASDAGGQAKCDKVVEDAQRASAALRETQRRLNNLASGRNNRETRATRRAFERVYGRGSATAANVRQVAAAAGAAADWLDSPDTQAVLAGAGEGDAYASVPEPGSGPISIYDRYFGHGGRERSSQARQGTLIHEAGHGGANMSRERPFFVDHPNGGATPYEGAYRAAGITAYREQFGTERTLNQADAFRCAVQPMSSTCP